ncbi:MAG: histidine-type phosphatase [Prevotella sp.]|nr:histidine-type phosphatase [Prevotella sp.]
MKNNRIMVVALALMMATATWAQTTKKEMLNDIYRTGSNYFAYPGPRQQKLSPPPAGYEPFYIFHYARHGSRYMSNNQYYLTAINMLDSAQNVGLLSPKGKEVLEKLRIGYADAWHRDGDLTELGGRQHREIAHRMYERFNDLLSQPLQVEAKSSTSRRCMLSMFNFCMEMQSLNPAMEITLDASKHDMKYVVEDLSLKPGASPESDAMWQQAKVIFERAHNPQRLVASLITDTSKLTSSFNGRELMEALYNVAEDLQNVPELGISLIDIFTPDELFDMWQGYNVSWLLDTGLVPGSAPYYHILNEVVDSIMASADKVLMEGKPAMTLRFSHDSSVLPLAYVLGLKEAMGATNDLENLYKYISIDKIIPMAANIQMVFYRKNQSNDILVKFLLNENETTIPGINTKTPPYYHWNDVRSYIKSRRQ